MPLTHILPKVSIVVPIYNSENYLEECLDSIVNQTFRDTEIILIDDGSTDHSLDIMNEFASKDKRVFILSQTNQGVSAARNTGLSMANGDYVLCVDSDDTVEPDTIEMLYSIAIETNAEIVMGNALIEYPNGGRAPFLPRSKDLRSVSCQTGEWCFAQLMKTYAPPLVYLFFIKRDFVITNHLYFREGIVHEDDIWCTKVMLLARSMSLIDFTYYHYRQREGSIMHSNNHRYRLESYAVVVKELLDFVEGNPFSAETTGYVYAKIFVIFHSMCCLLPLVKKETGNYHTYFSSLLTKVYPALTYAQQRYCLEYYCNALILYMDTLKNTGSKEDIEKMLQEVADILQTMICSGNKNVPTQGKMGIVIFLFHYARHTENTLYEDIAYSLIEELQSSLSEHFSLNYANGLTGIGVGIEYLVQHQFIDTDTDEILEDFDLILDKQLRERKLYLSLQTVMDIKRYFFVRHNNPQTKKRAFLNGVVTEATALILLHTRAYPSKHEEVMVWGMLEGFGGLGLSLLSAINEQHNSWEQLII
ncbi:hypothetical protein FACS189415_4530 [Bacteroidia bacterium]|nr:hypothetical protein FACS189415_4530 [Bacteroidia bacterium]